MLSHAILKYSTITPTLAKMCSNLACPHGNVADKGIGIRHALSKAPLNKQHKALAMKTNVQD